MEEPIERWLARHEQKELVRFVAVGSVDDGKSTLIGRLLHDTNAIFDDQLAAVRKASRDVDAETEIDFALFTDGLKAEREQGITIDVAYRYFATERRKYILADTPGHVQYTRNMATGASTADVAVILLDARLGVLPQSRRHATIASLLGIRQLTVAVNKMDLVDWSEEVFLRLREEFGAFVAPLGFVGVTFLPISARKGDNVVTPSARMPWYQGPTVLEHLERVPVARDREAEDLRYVVQYVLRPHLNYRAFAGVVASGVVRPGDEVVVLPSQRRTKVKAIDTWEGERDAAYAPTSVALRLVDEVDVSRGDMIAHPSALPVMATRLDAMLVWLHERPLDPARSYLLRHTSRVVPARVEKVLGALDPTTLDAMNEDALTLGLNDIGRVVVRCNRPLFCDPYTRSRATGCFILVDAATNDTVAAGMIREARGASDGERSLRDRSRVSATERRERLGHRGAVVWIEAPSGVDGAPLACAVERKLFDEGVLATLVEGAALTVSEAAQRCAEAGVVAVCLLDGAWVEARDATRLAVGADAFVGARARSVWSNAPREEEVTFAPEEADGVAAALVERLVAQGLRAR